MKVIRLVITMVQMSRGADAQHTACGMRGTRFIATVPISLWESRLPGPTNHSFFVQQTWRMQNKVGRWTLILPRIVAPSYSIHLVGMQAITTFGMLNGAQKSFLHGMQEDFSDVNILRRAWQ